MTLSRMITASEPISIHKSALASEFALWSGHGSQCLSPLHRRNGRLNVGEPF